jgi:hypothetical protein
LPNAKLRSTRRSRSKNPRPGANWALLEAERGRTTAVRSAFAGRVVEIKAGRGTLVSGETPVVLLERSGNAGGVEVVMYVASNDGKKDRRRLSL